MLKQIAAVSPELIRFVDDLKLPQPQHRHVRQIADGLITIEGDKNLSAHSALRFFKIPN